MNETTTTKDDRSSRGEYEQLEQSLIASPDDTSDLVATSAKPMIEVVAPATLPEGYKFEAQMGGKGKSFTVTVPTGGVEEGQKFSVPLVDGEDVEDAIAVQRVNIPVGHWRDGLFSCCNYGCIHSMVWNAFCFPYLTPTVLLGQVMTRLQLNLRGDPGSIGQAAYTFRVLLGVVLYEVIFNRWALGLIIRGLLMCEQKETLDYRGYEFEAEVLVPCPNSHPWFDILHIVQPLTTFAVVVYTILAMAKTRAYIRSKYGIPEKTCRGCEDFCCSLWCSCCTIAQMARHTTDYDTYRGVCCSDTGLPAHAPSIV